VRLRYTADARRSLRNLRADLQRRAPGTADKTLREIRDAVHRAQRMPRSGRQVPEFSSPNVREMIVLPYRVWDELLDNEVLIIAVFHGARDTR
jgi:plasmid stabilization system protein ParE